MTLLTTYTDDVTPDVADVWIKNVARPFLNQVVTVVGFDAVSYAARGGVVNVLGRRLPVAITEVQGSRETALVLRTATQLEREAVELLFSFGDAIYLQKDDACVVPNSGHFYVGAVSVSPPVGAHDSTVRYVTVPLIEVDAPDDSIVGATITYLGVIAAWATYAALLADPNVPTYLDLLEYVSAPADEVVG